MFSITQVYKSHYILPYLHLYSLFYFLCIYSLLQKNELKLGKTLVTYRMNNERYDETSHCI